VKHLWIGPIVVGGALLVDYIRLHRAAWMSRRAARAAALLTRSTGADSIDGIEMPAADDPRWKPSRVIVSQSGISAEHAALALGECSVRMDTGTVFVGDGPAVPNGSAYGKRVVAAYRARLVRESTK